MTSTHRAVVIVVALGFLLPCASAEKNVAQRDDFVAELAEIDKALLAGKWKSSLKQTQKLAEAIVKNSWTTKDLEEVLAEAAFQQAVAFANLNERYKAIWYWHIAQNLDFYTVRKKDFEAYGAGGKLLREFPLREEGEVPTGFVTRPHTGAGTKGPELPKIKETKILTNTGAQRQRRLGDFNVELVLDEQGKIHHPVVLSTQQHPIVLYWVLEGLLDLPKFGPALYLGEPVDCLFDLTMPFKILRW